MPWKKMILTGCASMAALVVAAIIVLPRAIHRFFYPPAPPMPPVIVAQMPSILAELEAVLKTNAPAVHSNLQAGLRDAEIQKLEAQAKIQLPSDVRDLYRWHNGSRSGVVPWDGPIPGHRFLPLEEMLGLIAVPTNGPATLVQRGIVSLLVGHRESWKTLFDDGSSDGYFFDPKRKPEEGNVFYAFAQDRTYVFFPSAKNLMAWTLECYKKGLFRWKEDGTNGPHLDDDFEQSMALWKDYGAVLE